LLFLLGKRGNIFFDRGDYDNASKTYQASLDLTDEDGLCVRLRALIGKSLAFGGHADQACACFDQAYARARETGDDYLLGFVLGQESHAAGHNKDYEMAHQVAAEQVALAERLVEKDRSVEHSIELYRALVNLGSAKRELVRQRLLPEQELHEALALHERAQQLAQELDGNELRAVAWSALAEDYHALGKHAVARQCFEKARMLWQSSGVTRELEEDDQLVRDYGYEEAAGEGR
jgi:tetratricopeptide (TPR) repeat protein